ncbi:hypothetical protein [Pseudomonas chlororaphis]|uniref:hypothetical protein n=1 Tax=Pseudomonas chlororaphis TaxID=587753 RepID=UPI002366CA15|nr:hypothetical protein [Pseudomonas chlororaphis]WDH21028.1 hypothetical protein PUP50_23915 [Pseudomonas chlororaphis]
MTEHIYWRDIEDLAGNWNGLGVDVQRPASGKPNLRLLSGNNRRMQLVLGDQTLLWGTMSCCLYGVWLVRNHLLEHLPQTLVGPIDSPQVEQQQRLDPALRLKAWSRFFRPAVDAAPTGLFLPRLLAGTGPAPGIPQADAAVAERHRRLVLQGRRRRPEPYAAVGDLRP